MSRPASPPRRAERGAPGASDVPQRPEELGRLGVAVLVEERLPSRELCSMPLEVGSAEPRFE